jgi:ligand-binding sensor domain-containing protein
MFQTHFDGTDDNDPESELHVSAIIDLTFPSKCQGQLKVSSAQLKYRNMTVRVETKPKGDYEYDDETEEETSQHMDINEEIDLEKVLHESSAQFSNDVEQMNLRFDFRDGLIQEVCPESEEQVWVTNFKRGILSALQNTMSRLDLDHKSRETDVSGKCNVNYQFIGATDTSIVINKTKDISSCQNRNKFKSIIQTTPYEFGKVSSYQCRVHKIKCIFTR